MGYQKQILTLLFQLSQETLNTLKYEVQNKLCQREPSKFGKPESQLNLPKSRNLAYNSNWKYKINSDSVNLVNFVNLNYN